MSHQEVLVRGEGAEAGAGAGGGGSACNKAGQHREDSVRLPPPQQQQQRIKAEILVIDRRGGGRRKKKTGRSPVTLPASPSSTVNSDLQR